MRKSPDIYNTLLNVQMLSPKRVSFPFHSSKFCQYFPMRVTGTGNGAAFDKNEEHVDSSASS